MAIKDDTIEQHPPKRSAPDLLPEMITEILSRLPVKSLLRFRSVSKSWRSMISDPKFVKTHLTICSKDDENAHHKLIFSSERHCNIVIEICHLSPVFNGFSVNLMELDYPMKHTEPNSTIWIAGSVNGLIYIVIDKLNTFLWNPSTRISKKLPHSGIEQSHVGFIEYGLGYDEPTDDYKVVIFCPYDKRAVATNVMVYSSRTGFWRRIGDFPWRIWIEDPCKFLNGACHWFAAVKTGSNYSTFIVSLDLANETYGEVAQPSYGEGESSLTHAILGECLCVLSYFNGDRTNVWTMKEYGVKESWTKLTSIPFYMIDRSNYAIPFPLYLSKKGEIFLNIDSHIVLYDPQTKSFKNPDIRNFDARFEASIYVESLVSPLMQEDLERQQ